MIRTLYIFPHPDDESFGPAPVIYKQIENAEEVFLLTLTAGGATTLRHKFGYSIEEMGNVRKMELQNAAASLNITNLTQLELEDGGLEAMNVMELEAILIKEIQKTKPNIIVTYPVHGISGHHDHLVIHAVVKRLYLELKNRPGFEFIKRLAFFTLPVQDYENKKIGNPNVKASKPEHVDCIVSIGEKEINAMKKSLDCYVTYKEIIEKYDVVNHIGNEVHFEFYQEDFKPALTSLSEKLKN